MKEEGMTVDAKVWTLAYGLNFSQAFAASLRHQ
jgi:hypothetical protein